MQQRRASAYGAGAELNRLGSGLFGTLMSSPEYNGALDFDEGVDRASLLAHLDFCLRKINARDVQISSDSVSFRGGLFRGVNNWNLLIPFGRGKLVVDDVRHEVRYRLSFRQLMLAALTLLGLAACLAWSDFGHNPFTLVALAVGWLWLVGGNLAIGIPRFRRFLRDSIDALPAQSGSSNVERGTL